MFDTASSSNRQDTVCFGKGVRTMQTGICELYRPPDQTRPKPGCAAADVLAELFVLLENYAPEWYREEHHKALRSTLEKMNRLGG